MILLGFDSLFCFFAVQVFMLPSRVPRACVPFFQVGKSQKVSLDSLRIISALKILGFRQSGNHVIIFISILVPSLIIIIIILVKKKLIIIIIIRKMLTNTLNWLKIYL